MNLKGLTSGGGSTSRVLNQVGLTVRDLSFCRTVGIGTNGAQICAGNTLASNGLVKDSCQVIKYFLFYNLILFYMITKNNNHFK